MNGSKFFTRALIGVLVVLLAAPIGVSAQTNEENQNQTYSKAELDQMLAPIALYPDSLLAQVLIAATYPSQVVEAERWVKEHKGLSKDQLNAELDKKDWDLSVKALVPFPQVLAMMDKHLDWTTKLGEAFLAQQSDVMASIQGLRAKAYAQGSLKTTEQQKVIVEGQDIEIEPVNPEMVYVPYYNPAVVYGSWWWPGYPPYAYYPYGQPFITIGSLGFLAAVGVGAFWNSGWGAWNWRGRNVNVNINRTVNINRNDPSITHNMRTASFHRVANQRRAAGSVGAGRTGVGRRPSETSVQRKLSQGRTGKAARGGGVPRRTGNVARGGGSHKTSNVARGGGQVSRGKSSQKAISASRGRSSASRAKPKRQAVAPKPQPQRRAASPRREPQPQRHAASPRPERQPQHRAAPQRPERQPQRRAAAPRREPQPQRHAASPRPERQPQHRAAAPRREPQPQRHAASPRPERQPQHRAAAPRPEPQPQHRAAAPRPQSGRRCVGVHC